MIFRAIVITIVCHLSNAFVETEYDDNLDGIAITPLNFNSNDYPVKLTQRKLKKEGTGKKHDKKSSKKSAACKKSKGSKTDERLCEIVKVKEINLGVDTLGIIPSEVKADVYTCETSNECSGPPPLVVFACGGTIQKGVQKLFAETLTRKGYVVMILDHPFQFGPGPVFNFAQPQDFNSAIDYAKSQTDFEVDSDSVALLGHSYGFGAIITALNELCSMPFCNNAVVPFNPSVKAVAGFGASLRMVGGGGPDQFIDSNNQGFPTFILNGAGDSNSFDTDVTTGENFSIGTFDRLDATKILTVVSNLDHFSIADKVINPGENPFFDDVPSTLPRIEQIGRVVDIFNFYLEGVFAGKPQIDVCKGLKKEFTGIVDMCLEEYEE
mmetsp:Transcript_15033/g.17805  ORF Transcript_15033/g.17805 Transcript_15033/m.17805 type:complete len:381 (+) Transcript_15033:62-1204(+)